MGVDGLQSGGFVAHQIDATLSLQANSESVPKLEFCYNDFIQNMEVRLCEFQITYTATKKVRSLSGHFTTKQAGSISRLLDGHTYGFSLVDGGFENA